MTVFALPSRQRGECVQVRLQHVERAEDVSCRTRRCTLIQAPRAPGWSWEGCKRARGRGRRCRPPCSRILVTETWSLTSTVCPSTFVPGNSASIAAFTWACGSLRREGEDDDPGYAGLGEGLADFETDARCACGDEEGLAGGGEGGSRGGNGRVGRCVEGGCGFSGFGMLGRQRRRRRRPWVLLGDWVDGG